MKKFRLPILVGLLIGGIVSGGYILWIKGRNSSPGVPKRQSVAPTPTPVRLLTWNDPNGFIFQYPEGLSINKHDEDKDNYAHIEFTHPDHLGKLIVWGKDAPSNVTDALSWVKGDTRFAGASILDTEMGGQPAKKIITAGTSNILVVGAVYDNIVWSVEATFEEPEFWTSVLTSITNSFTFVSRKSDVTNAGSISSDTESATDNTPVDEEEVVE